MAVTAVAYVRAQRARARILADALTAMTHHDVLAAPGSEYKPLRFNHVPVDAFLRALASAATENNLRRYQRQATEEKPV